MAVSNINAIIDNNIHKAVSYTHLDVYKRQVLEYGRETLIVPGLHDHHIHLMPAGMLAKYLNIFNLSLIHI